MKKLMGLGLVMVVALGLAVGESLARGGGGGGRGGGGGQQSMRGQSGGGQYGYNAPSAAMQQRIMQNRYRMMMQAGGGMQSGIQQRLRDGSGAGQAAQPGGLRSGVATGEGVR